MGEREVDILRGSGKVIPATEIGIPSSLPLKEQGIYKEVLFKKILFHPQNVDLSCDFYPENKSTSDTAGLGQC